MSGVERAPFNPQVRHARALLNLALCVEQLKDWAEDRAEPQTPAEQAAWDERKFDLLENIAAAAEEVVL
jgi:hypothetical protein